MHVVKTPFGIFNTNKIIFQNSGLGLCSRVMPTQYVISPYKYVNLVKDRYSDGRYRSELRPQ